LMGSGASVAGEPDETKQKRMTARKRAGRETQKL